MYFKYRIVHNGKGYKYFICLNKEIIGCFTLEVVQNKYLFLYDFALLSKYRGNGYSKKILKMIYREVRILHFRNLYLTVRDGNNIALNLYRKEGFQEIKELK